MVGDTTDEMENAVCPGQPVGAIQAVEAGQVIFSFEKQAPVSGNQPLAADSGIHAMYNLPAFKHA